MRSHLGVEPDDHLVLGFQRGGQPYLQGGSSLFRIQDGQRQVASGPWAVPSGRVAVITDVDWGHNIPVTIQASYIQKMVNVTLYVWIEPTAAPASGSVPPDPNNPDTWGPPNELVFASTAVMDDEFYVGRSESMTSGFLFGEGYALNAAISWAGQPPATGNIGVAPTFMTLRGYLLDLEPGRPWRLRWWLRP
jgi:hypothetical protein